jgi:enoyl-[acyl-carrier protein] reductase I
MGLLEGKTALIFGVGNHRSIAWGVARAMHAEGCELGFNYARPKSERRVRPLAESVSARLIEECDVTDDEAIARIFEKAKETYGKIDILIHSVAFADRKDLRGRFVETSREGFMLALDVSAYSLVALARAAEPLMTDGGAIVAMTAYSGSRIMPSYNVMGVAKAALEACMRYLAYDLGPKGIRVNAIAAGPVKTLAAAGLQGVREMIRFSERVTPLPKAITAEDVGQLAAWLCSDRARAITGEIVFVDAGWNILELTLPRDDIEQGKLGGIGG